MKNLNRLSLGGGLGLLSLAVLVHAGVQWASATQRPAVADGRDARSVPSGPDRGADRTGDRTARPVAMGGGDGCVTGDPLNWFGAMRELPGCTVTCDPVGCRFNIALIENEGTLDINGDGTLDFANGVFAYLVTEGQIQAPQCILSVSESVNAGGQVSFLERCGLRTEPFLALVLAQGFVPDLAFVYPEGWRDLDSDGDLDLVVLVQTFVGPTQSLRAFWLENTGFEATQPLVGDLDGDGAVGASDLTMLLGGWTGD